jgi:fatty-acyl-CoA synthase
LDRQAALATRFPEWIARSLDGMLDLAAGEFPDRPYIVTDERAWTYRELADWSRRLAAGLISAGVRPGDHVALLLANYPEFVALKYAISRVGAVAVPINILNRQTELGYVLAQSDAVLLVTMDCFRGLDTLAMLDQLMPGWEQNGGGQAFPKLRTVVVFPTGSEPARAQATPFAALEHRAPEGLAFPSSAPDAVADIIYTSGTTGAPKGVMLSHDQVLRTAFTSALARAFEDARRIVFALPMYHVYGYGEGMLPVLFVGGAIVPRLRFEAADLLQAIARHRVTDALLVPTMTLAVIDAARDAACDLSSLTSVLSSGTRAPERIWREIGSVLGVAEITTGYGMTEVTASSTVTRPDDPFERLLETNGRLRDAGVTGDPALGGRLVAYRVVDPDSEAVLPAGAVGELRAKGPGVSRGYYNKPAETAAAFDAEGWFRTGDLGQIDSEGYLTLAGRLKESYRCGGEQVLPSEVEDVLTSHPNVLQAHVVPLPDERMGEVGVALVVPSVGADVKAEALLALVRERLARFKVPRHLFFVDASEIPTTASGRARKFMLAETVARMVEAA